MEGEKSVLGYQWDMNNVYRFMGVKTGFRVIKYGASREKEPPSFGLLWEKQWFAVPPIIHSDKTSCFHYKPSE